jgi:outer membrane receptor for ferrienterochelin and colicin
MQHGSARFLFGALLIVGLAFAPSARADDTADEADLHFQLGADRYEAGDFKGALEHFLLSNRLVANRNVVFNIARTYEQMKLLPDAYRYYVLALEGETPSGRKRVDDALARISPSVAVVRVETDPPGGTVFVDRRDLGPRGNAPRALGLPPGKHKIMVDLPGYEPAEQDGVELKIGTAAPVRFKLVQIVGTVHVEGQPAGASVHVDRPDGPVACLVPCDVTLPPGQRLLVITKDGFESATLPVEVPTRAAVTARVALATQTGNVLVSADVNNALIEVDGQPSGFTPAVLNIAVGPHTVRVAQSGYRPLVQTIDVKPKEQVKLELQLTAQAEVTAASRTAESVDDAPASITIISQEEIHAMGYPTVAEAVRGVRGIYLSDDRSYTTVGVRGFSPPGDYGNRILVLIDGMPTNDNYISSSYVGFDGRTDLADIERIEIVRGPGSVLYGTGAFFGVINLVTRNRNNPTHGEAGISAVENSVGRARVSYTWRAAPYAGVWTSVSGATSTGRDFYFPEYVSTPGSPTPELDANGRPVDGNARGVDGFDAGTVSGRAWYKAATVQWFLTSRKKTIPTGEYNAIFSDPRSHFADTRSFVEARFEPQLTKELQSLSRAHYNLYDFDGFAAEPAPSGGARDTYRGRWGGLEQRLVYAPGDSLRLTLGGEVIRHFTTQQRGESDAGPYLFDDKGNPGRDDPFTVLAGYALGDVTPTKGLKLSAGARIDHYSSLDFDVAAAFNPRLAVIVKPYAQGNLKFLAGKAFRAPSVYELHYTSTQQAPGTPKLEQIYSGEVEFSHRFSPTVTATVAGYANYVKDLVELRDVPTGCATPPCAQYGNSNAPVLVLGSELEVRRDWRQGWMLALSYTLQKARYLEDPTRRNVPNSPLHLGSVKGAVPIIGRTLMGMTRLSVEGPRPDGNFHEGDPPQRDTEVGVIWDLVLSGEIERLGVRYALGAYNVADHRYDAVPSVEFRQRTIVQNGRTFLASLSASF